MITFIKDEKTIQTPPLNRITGWATLGSKNCNQAFAIADNESFTSVWRNVGALSLPYWRVFENKQPF